MKTIQELKTAAEYGRMPDDINPLFLFSCVTSELLSQIVKGEIDPIYLAKIELVNRGCGSEGEWIGFNNAKKEFNL